MNPHRQFEQEIAARVLENGRDRALLDARDGFLRETIRARYSYNFSWQGRPIIQYPQDMVAMQEIIWATRPDLIVETGIAHGGSLIFSASMLALLDLDDATRAGTTLDPRKPSRRVVGVDIDIRPHNREAITEHPMAHRIDMIQGSSIETSIVDQVREIARRYQRILVCLDSNHTHDHVLAELEAYAPLTTPGSYCVVFDTVVEDLPPDATGARPWGPGNNPKTAVHEYLARIRDSGRVAADGAALRFDIDATLDAKVLLSVVSDGYLKRVG